MNNIEHFTTLIKNERIAPDTHILEFKAPALAGTFKPGQFLEIDCGGYINRPFALMFQDEEKGTIKVGVKLIGKQTTNLASFEEGRTVRVIGPLGHGFRIKGIEQIIAVGGGSGIFPLFETLLQSEKQQIETHFICGFRSETDAFPRSVFEPLNQTKLFFSSDRGGLDFTGHAGAALEHYFESVDRNLKTLLIACGPNPMLRFVQKFAKEKELSCQLSVESNMACGLGLCTGCVVEVLDQYGNKDRVRCCIEGPVFSAERLILG